MGGPLEGLTVVDLTTTLTGAHISQTLADFGCEVILVEPPGGNPLRSQPAWPFWGRGKKSIVLDLKDPSDVATAQSLAGGADVVMETWRPGKAERFGLGYDQVSERNARLVYLSVSGFGRGNPLSHLKGYEPIVAAKLGMLDAFGVLASRPGPKYASTPYCSFSAAQLGLHGILAALIERESSGLGQRVETTLVQGILAHDTWSWLIRLVTTRFPDAFTPQAPMTQSGGTIVINSPLFLRLMVGFSKDGRYMQFSQQSERLYQAMLRLLGLDQLIAAAQSAEPDDLMTKIDWLEKAIEVTRTKTYDEWLAEFDREPDVWAEMFRDGSELLHHRQLIADGRIASIDDPFLGPVLQPGPLTLMNETPADVTRPAPELNADSAALRASAPIPGPTGASSSGPATSKPPLHGVTVIEMGTFYAAPFGASLLADLGARVIKVEQHDGDPIRNMMGFPEIAGIKVLQGKESIAVDIATPQGREIVLELVRHADVVLQSFRAGVAERHGLTADDLLAVNADLVYVNAPGYGVGPPYGQRPAYAPTIGAASGLAFRNVGGRENLRSDPDLSMSEVRLYAGRLGAATLSGGHADGFAALGVCSAMLLGLLARRRGAPGQQMSTTMLSTMAHCLAEDMIEYEGRAQLAKPDKDLYGLGPRYRLYQTSDGWVFLAAPAEDDWERLAATFGLAPDLKDDARLAEVLVDAFGAGTSEDWEAKLTALDVACVAVVPAPVEEVVWFSGELGPTLGITTTTTHPVLGEYPRLAPTVKLSRSGGVAGPAPLVGEQTDSVLRTLGYGDDGIAKLRKAGVIR